MEKILSTLVFACVMAAAADPIAFSDDFAAPGAKPSEAWELVSGAFPVESGRLSTRAERGAAFAVIRAVPEMDAFEYGIRFTVSQRLSPGGYATAGIVLYQDGANHWRLQLAEGPDQKRYVEMGETLGGVWQAHSSGPNKLRCAESSGGAWEYGRPYLMKISLSTNGIAGEVSDVESGKSVARYRWFWDKADAVQMGRPGVTANGFSASWSMARVSAERAQAAAAGIALEDGRMGRCAILASGRADAPAQRIPLLAKAARGAGFGVTLLSCEEISRPKALLPGAIDILILPDPAFPAPAREPFLRYLRNGGHVVLLGGRAFGSMLYPVGGAWLSKPEIERAISGVKDFTPLLDFRSEAPAWDRSTDRKDSPSTARVDGDALRFDIIGYTLWDTFAAALPRKLPANALVVLDLKGDGNTTQLAVELTEKDGARFIATVELSAEWKRQVLLPGRFKAWDGKAKEKAGIDLRSVERISFGLAGTHTPAVPRGDHRFWVGRIAMAENRFGAIAEGAGISLPVFGEDDEAPLAGIASVGGVPGAPIPFGEALPLPVEGISAVGYGIPNESQSVPLLAALDARGRPGALAAGMLLHYGGAWRGGAWLYSGVTSDAFYSHPAFAAFLARALVDMKKGALLSNAKAENAARPSGLPLKAPAPKGFVHIGKDRHFAAPDGRRLFVTGANYIGSFATAVRFCQDEYFDPRELEANFRMASDAGVNVIRLFHVHGLAADLMKGDRRKLDTILELARRYRIYLLIETSAGLSETGGDMAGICAILTKLGDMLRDEPMVFGYDLRNEPTIAFVAGWRYPEGRKPAVHTTRLADSYPEEAAEIRKLAETRPAWLRLPSSITGSEAENAIAAIHLWNKYTREYNIGSTTFGALPDSGLPMPPKWEPLVKAVDQSFGLWIQMQKEALRKTDGNHLVSVGYNLVFAALPCNDRLDFVSHHVYGKPFSFSEVMENVTALDRLKKRFPLQPISLGEFGYSTGIGMPGSGNLDPYTSSVGELIHYLYAFANGFEGCKKWMLVDWPIPVMQRFGSWSQHALEGKRYEARFGFYACDGTSNGKPKPIAFAMKFLRDYADATPPSGKLNISEGPLSIGAVYVYQNSNALFVGHREYRSEALAFKSARPVNVMLAWGPDGIRAMASADVRVELETSRLGPFGQKVSGRHGGASAEGKRLTVDMLEGEALTIR